MTHPESRTRTRFVSILALALLAIFLSVPGVADAAPTAPQKALTEMYGSVAFSQNSDISAISASIDVEFPLGTHFAIGPLATYDSVRPKGESWTSDTAVGGVFVLNFANDHLGPYCSAGATALTSDFHGWTLLPECGFKFGTDHIAFRVGAQHPIHYDVGESPVDLEGTRVAGFFGGRW